MGVDIRGISIAWWFGFVIHDVIDFLINFYLLLILWFLIEKVTYFYV